MGFETRWVLRPATALLLASACALAPGAGHAGTVVLVAGQDTWIEGLDDGTPPADDSQLGICPFANYWIYLAFDVSASAVGGEIQAAELRMTRTSGSRPDEISVYFIHDDAWSEATLTGQNRPEPTSPDNSEALGVGEEVGGETYDRWMSAPLTERIALEAAGDGTVTLMLRENPAPMFDVRFYTSADAVVPVERMPLLVLQVTPPEVATLQLASASPAELSWQPNAGARYDVLSGRLTDLRADGGIDAADCVAEDLAAATFIDPQSDPPVGQGDYWLVRAQTVAGAGGWGTDSAGVPRQPLVDCEIAE